MKTGSQIQGDIYRLLCEDRTLCSMISGSVYREGYRPRDSKQEDIIVVFTAGTAGQIQSGVVTINIFVPDIDAFNNGVLVQDGMRTSALEMAVSNWFESLHASKTDYRFRLEQTIYTESATDINQHFVVVKLRYDYYNGK